MPAMHLPRCLAPTTTSAASTRSAAAARSQRQRIGAGAPWRTERSPLASCTITRPNRWRP